MHLRPVYLKNFRRGLATNSSSTHSIIYRNEGEVLKDLNIFDLDYYDRYDSTIAATKKAKIKYILAAIVFDEALVEIMSSFYPEMKKYYPRIKKSMKKGRNGYRKDTFGMCYRGELTFGSNNTDATVDYLRNIIDNDEIVIIGGSDEMDFIYDTCKDHAECPEPSDVTPKYGIYKNGNYWIGYGRTPDRVYVHKCENDEYFDYDNPVKDSFCGRLRFATSDEPIVPEYPELIDLKITNACEHGCRFCYMNATKDGKHADIRFLKTVLVNCGMPDEHEYHRVEFSIGGGNILLYPHLEEFLSFAHSRGHIVNVTIKADDCNTIIKNEDYLRMFKDYVDGIGVSLQSPEDVDKMVALKEVLKVPSFGPDGKYLVAHLIPEYLGVELTCKITEAITRTHLYSDILYLGYKTTGRGTNQQWKVFEADDLARIFDNFYYIGIDTTFANRYNWWLKDNFSLKHTVTYNEGEFSMYIDGVEEKAYKSSYQTEKPYNMHVDYKNEKKNPWYNVKEAFSNIRRDNGFTVYDDVAKHYWDDKS